MPRVYAEVPDRVSPARPSIFLWAAAILFCNHVLSAVTDPSSSSLSQFLTDLVAVGIFQYMAWYAVFRLLYASDPTAAASWRDTSVAILLCLLVFLPTGRMIWVAASGIAIYLCAFGAADRNLRAAGVVLGALTVQEFWGHILFNLIAFPLLRAETAVVGTLLQASHPGTVWHDNIITQPSGYGIVVYGGCSSFHNVAVALLCWITLAELRHQGRLGSNILPGILIGGVTILINFARLYLMGIDAHFYDYWHDGTGSEIYQVGTSLVVLSLSLYCRNRRVHTA